MNYKKLYFVIVIFGIVAMFFGGSLAYWEWTTNTSERTNVVLTVTSDFKCEADGGGNITSEEKSLVPTDCMDTTYAIKRTITVSPTIYSNEMNVLMDLQLDINNIGTGLSNSDNFRYALTIKSDSCTNGVVGSGTFKGKRKGDSVPLFTEKIYSSTLTDTYYLYIWLDSKETSSSTMNQIFDFSLNGNCTNQAKENPYYVVYSEQDSSLRFYKEEEGVITEGSTYNNLTATNVYKAY